MLFALTTLILCCGCEERSGDIVATPSASTYRPCEDIEDLGPAEVGSKLQELLKKKRYPCVERLLQIRTLAEPDLPVVSTLIGLLVSDAQLDVSAIPSTTKLVVLGYLNFHMKVAKAGGFDLERFGGFIREEAKKQNSESRGKALSLLFTIMRDSDSPTFVAAIQSGDDSNLVVGLYALADKCSPVALKSLREVLKHEAMLSYMRRFSQTESITKKLLESCPAALR